MYWRKALHIDAYMISTAIMSLSCNSHLGKQMLLANHLCSFVDPTIQSPHDTFMTNVEAQACPPGVIDSIPNTRVGGPTSKLRL